jgi:hypothetical protein
MSKSKKKALLPGDPAQESPPVEAAPEEPPPAQDQQAGTEAKEDTTGPAPDQAKEGPADEDQEAATDQPACTDLVPIILSGELVEEDAYAISEDDWKDSLAALPSPIVLDPADPDPALDQIKAAFDALDRETVRYMGRAVLGYWFLGEPLITFRQSCEGDFLQKCKEKGLDKNKVYRSILLRSAAADKPDIFFGLSIRKATELARKELETRLSLMAPSSKAETPDSAEATDQANQGRVSVPAIGGPSKVTGQPNKPARKGKKGPGRPPGPPVYRPLPPDPVAKCESGRSDGAKYSSNALLGIARDAVRTAVVDAGRGKVTEDEVLHLAGEVINWTVNDEVYEVDDWSLLRDNLKDCLDEFFAAFLAYSKHLPPVFIVQAAAEVLKYARMRLDKANAWDTDQDKLKDAIVDIRDYMAKIDGSVPPGV